MQHSSILARQGFLRGRLHLSSQSTKVHFNTAMAIEILSLSTAYVRDGSNSEVLVPWGSS